MSEPGSGPLAGLSLPELMDRLHDVVPPEPVSFLPQTQGWVVVGIWLVAVVLIAGTHLFVKWRKNRYRREAEASLNRLLLVEGESPAAAAEAARLVKRTALHAWPRQEVAALTGSAWAAFLVKSSRGDPLVSEAAESLASAAWHDSQDAATALAGARRWIRVHHA